MRVITGVARGRKLLSPEGMSVRPTTDRVKEAIFSIIHFHLAGSDVLDICAGSGQLGIEALSRGAKSAVFVENSRRNCRIIKENLELTRLQKGSKVVCEDAARFLQGTSDEFDIVLADPPYNLGMAVALLPLIERVVSPKGFVIIETERKCEMPEAAGELRLHKKYRHIKTDLWMYRKTRDDE